VSFSPFLSKFNPDLNYSSRLGKTVSKWELADMQARLYLNLGVTKEHIQQFDEALSFYDSSIKICKSNDLFELHHQCLMASGWAHSNKKSDTGTALNQFNAAIEVAKRIHDKNEKMCLTLLAKSGLFIKNGDFQSAKQVLKKAFKMKTPNRIDNEMIQRQLKTGEEQKTSGFLLLYIHSNSPQFSHYANSRMSS
jgi:NF-kappa-B inhibitor-like protein 2